MEWTILIVESRKLALQIAELDQVLFASTARTNLDDSTAFEVHWHHGRLTKLTNAGGFEFFLTVRTKELCDLFFGNEHFGLDIIAPIQRRKIEGTFLLFIFY